jgi:hypothetical protein
MTKCELSVEFYTTPNGGTINQDRCRVHNSTMISATNSKCVFGWLEELEEMMAQLTKKIESLT